MYSISKKLIGIVLLGLGGLASWHWYMKHFVLDNPAHELIPLFVILFGFGIACLSGSVKIK